MTFLFFLLAVNIIGWVAFLFIRPGQKRINSRLRAVSSEMPPEIQQSMDAAGLTRWTPVLRATRKFSEVNRGIEDEATWKWHGWNLLSALFTIVIGIILVSSSGHLGWAAVSAFGGAQLVLGVVMLARERKGENR